VDFADICAKGKKETSGMLILQSWVVPCPQAEEAIFAFEFGDGRSRAIPQQKAKLHSAVIARLW